MRVVTAAIETLRNKGFFARMADRESGIGSGQSITPEEIELRKPQRATQLLEGRISVVVRCIGKCQIVSKCFVATGHNNCPMQVYLDGQRLMSKQPAEFWRQSAGNTKADDHTSVYIDDIVSPSSIVGIEIYPRGASAPPGHQAMNSTCGVILIWTR